MWPDRTGRAATFDDVQYAPGRKFRVAREGLRLSGWQPVHGGHQGWGQPLHVGDVIECTGFGAGWGSDPGFGVGWTSEEAKANHASSCAIYPSIGDAWSYRPPAGSVVPIEEGE